MLRSTPAPDSMLNAPAKPDHIARLVRQRRVLEARSLLLQTIRAFFRERGFLEVETPVRVAAPANEDYIDAIPAGDAYLRTSPELHMKRLLAAGYARVFQIGPCFRAGEKGQRHLPGFTMLEWYRAEADYLDILADTIELLQSCSRALHGDTVFTTAGQVIDVGGPWQRLQVADACQQFAGVPPKKLLSQGTFDHVLVETIEPNLGKGRPTVLLDYPVELAALARPKPDNPTVAERWELYIAGLELANAFSELTDPEEQARRFAASAELRQRQGRTAYPVDQPFMDALASGLPASGGIALGVDRLLMVLLDLACINDAVAFVGPE